ncbi:thiamine pyrophosphate-binding protein [Ferroplasma sp.]|uniref:thiamine pyrophosphate-binding protein n=1 Tax=Ferroplasma sp. TaxID=2591003 RepID=UPI00307EA2B4
MDDDYEIKTLAQVLIRTLKLYGNNFIFGTTGAGMAEIQDAISVEKGLKWIQALHEFTAVSSAEGYALAKNKTGIAIVDRIVGTQNSIGALYSSYLNMAPLLVLASRDIPGTHLLNDPTSHYSSKHLQVIEPWVKWANNSQSEEMMEQDISKAFFITQLEPKGISFLTLRHDLMQKPYDGEKLRIKKFYYNKRVPDMDTIKKIGDDILSSKNPEIFISHAGRNMDYVKTMIDFAYHFGVGVKERRYFMSFPLYNEMHLGFVPRMYVPETGTDDLLLLFEFGILPGNAFPEDRKIIDFSTEFVRRRDIYSGGDYGSSNLFNSIDIECDLGPTLELLMRKINIDSTTMESIEDRRESIKEKHYELIKNIQALAEKDTGSGKLTDNSIGFILNKYWEDGMTMVNGSIKYYNGINQQVKLEEPGTFFSNPSGHLGSPIGMAYGAFLAKNEEKYIKKAGNYNPVVCITGDGDAVFGNITSALWSVKHYGLGVIYIILNNGSWAIEWPYFDNTTQKYVKNSKDAEFIDIDNPRMNFAIIAKGFSIDSYSVNTIEELEMAFQKAIKSAKKGEPSLIDIVLPEFKPN